MKTVAVLVPSFAVEYSLEFLAGIYDYFNEKDNFAKRIIKKILRMK